MAYKAGDLQKKEKYQKIVNIVQTCWRGWKISMKLN
jgi:hypothetical protein